MTLEFFFSIHFFPRSLLLLSKLCRTSLQSSDSCFHFLVVSLVTQVLWRFLFFVCVAWKDGASRENVRFCAGAFFSAWKRLCLLLAVYFSSCKLNFHTLTTKSANFPQSPSVTSTFRNVLKHEGLENSPLWCHRGWSYFTAISPRLAATRWFHCLVFFLKHAKMQKVQQRSSLSRSSGFYFAGGCKQKAKSAVSWRRVLVLRQIIVQGSSAAGLDKKR